jgi:hypothetical protein
MITKRFVFALLLAVMTLSGYAQQFGVSAAGLVFFQPNRVFETNNGRIINTGSSPAAGIRIEGNYILHSPFFPVSAYNGIGVTFVAPSTDSAVYNAQLKNGGGLELIGLQKSSMLNIGLRFGYEIPQQFDDFLIIHAGFGLSFTKITRTNIFPDDMASSAYQQSDFESETFDPVVSRGASFEILVGAVYEFEKFSLLGQYSFVKPWSGINEEPFRHGPSVGIFIPLYRFE